MDPILSYPNAPNIQRRDALKAKEAKPKRPLTSYNLFYRYKRNLILKAHSKGDVSKETVQRLIAATPGLEEYHGTPSANENEKEIRRAAIRSALLNHLHPKDNSSRSHVKTHGAMNFLEMGRVMSAAWKSIDDFSTTVFGELADEGRRSYFLQQAEYEKKYPTPSKNSRLSATLKKCVDTKPATKCKDDDDVAAATDTGINTTMKEGKPKRPLSAFNLFYRFKRDKILKAQENGDDSLETINQLIEAVPGLEEYPSHTANNMPDKLLKDLRRAAIRTALLNKLSPRDDSKRIHRKSHGAMSFTQMNKAMSSTWKGVDDFGRSVFQELAEEGRTVYRQRVSEFTKKSQAKIAVSSREETESPLFGSCHDLDSMPTLPPLPPFQLENEEVALPTVPTPASSPKTISHSSFPLLSSPTGSPKTTEESVPPRNASMAPMSPGSPIASFPDLMPMPHIPDNVSSSIRSSHEDFMKLFANLHDIDESVVEQYALESVSL